MSRDAQHAVADRPPSRLVAQLRSQDIWNHVPGDGAALVHPRPRLRGESPFPGEQGDRHDVAVLHECPHAHVGRVEQSCEVVRLGSVVGDHEQTERLPEQMFVFDEGFRVEAAILDGFGRRIGHQRVDRRARVERERPKRPHLHRVARRVSNRRVEMDVGHLVVALTESFPKPDRESPTRPFVAVDSRRVHDPRCVEKRIEDAYGQGCSLVDDDSVRVVG